LLVTNRIAYQSTGLDEFFGAVDGWQTACALRDRRLAIVSCVTLSFPTSKAIDLFADRRLDGETDFAPIANVEKLASIPSWRAAIRVCSSAAARPGASCYEKMPRGTIPGSSSFANSTRLPASRSEGAQPGHFPPGRARLSTTPNASQPPHDMGTVEWPLWPRAPPEVRA